jgi:hypothetical protein
MDTIKLVEKDVNADPLTKEHGSHPVGTGIGAAGGAAAGAAAGAVAGGPIGAVIGGVVGAVAGGAAGHVAGEAIDPTQENSYWEANYKTRRYVESSRPYSDYQDAYRYGWEYRLNNPNPKWNDVQAALASGWDNAKGKSALAWAQAQGATKDAWYRVEKALHRDDAHVAH